MGLSLLSDDEFDWWYEEFIEEGHCEEMAFELASVCIMRNPAYAGASWYGSKQTSAYGNKI